MVSTLSCPHLFVGIGGSELNNYSSLFCPCLSLFSGEFRGIVKANIADLTASLLFWIGNVLLEIGQEPLPISYESNALETVFITYSNKVYVPPNWGHPGGALDVRYKYVQGGALFRSRTHVDPGALS